MGNKIVEFWRNNAMGMYNDIDTLKKEIKEAFLDEFLENKKHWDNVLDEFNNDIITSINKFGFDSSKKLSYDEFIQLILEALEKWIDENGYIFEEDTPAIITSIKNKVMTLFLDEISFMDKKEEIQNNNKIQNELKPEKIKFDYNEFKQILFF